MKSIEGPLVLAVDIGSSSTRAWVYDSRGRAVAGIGTQVDHALRTSVDGRSEDEAEAALARLVRCIDTALAQAGHLAVELRAVAVDTYVSNLLGVDAKRREVQSFGGEEDAAAGG